MHGGQILVQKFNAEIKSELIYTLKNMKFKKSLEPSNLHRKHRAILLQQLLLIHELLLGLLHSVTLLQRVLRHSLLLHSDHFKVRVGKLSSSVYLFQFFYLLLVDQLLLSTDDNLPLARLNHLYTLKSINDCWCYRVFREYGVCGNFPATGVFTYILSLNRTNV